jgi:hypothetical protein
MKKLVSILNCLKNKIKNYFFINSDADVNHECEKLLSMSKSAHPQDVKLTEEYLENYKVTTRWQTL